MSIFSFFYHLFIFLIGVLLSVPFALLLIYIFTSNTPNDPIHQVTSLLFPSKQSKSDILTIPTNEVSFHSVWMFGVIATHRKFSGRTKLQPMYLKLYHQYLFIHLTSKHLRNFHSMKRNDIHFSEVLIFDLSQAKIELKPYEQFRTKYWSNKTPIVLSQLRSLARYHIEKKKKNQQEEDIKKSMERFRQVVFHGFTNKDEIHLYTLTTRSKEEWFYRLYNSIKFYSTKQRTISQLSTDTSSYYSNIPLDQIETEYNKRRYLLNIEENKIHDHHSSIKIKDFPNVSTNQTWRTLLTSFSKRIYNSSRLLSPINKNDRSEKLNDDYLCLINNILSRCTINFYENFDVRNYFKKKIQHGLKHLKLPYYIQWIRMSNFHFDDIHPKIENVKKTWFNQNGLWTAVDFTYQGNISIEFTIKINLIRKQNQIINKKSSILNHQNNSLIDEYSFIPTIFKRLFYFRDNIQVLKTMINTILTITINIRCINGVLLINVPLPPSDRLWFGFEDMPLIDFDVHHRHIFSNPRENKSYSIISFISAESSINSNKELNQLQTTINHLLSRWIKKQIQKEFVLPNMYDICMKWCNNPFEINIKENLLLLAKYRINHLLWLNQNDLEIFDRHFIPCRQKSSLPIERIYLIGKWKQKKLYKKIIDKRNQEKLLLFLPKRFFPTDTFFIFEH